MEEQMPKTDAPEKAPEKKDIFAAISGIALVVIGASLMLSTSIRKYGDVCVEPIR